MKKSAGILIYRIKRNHTEPTHNLQKNYVNSASVLHSSASKNNSTSSASVLRNSAEIEVLLVHPGGPFYKNKDLWDIPKGEIEENEEPLQAAVREFKEETGLVFSSDDLNKIIFFDKFLRHTDKKTIYIFLIEKNFGNNLVPKSNFIEIEFPAKSKRFIKIPEIDKMDYFNLKEAKEKVFPWLKELLEKFEKFINQVDFDQKIKN
ncbi:MAG: hypothetical protein KatS3mg096_466 [Candidatus Parcubacteria bacterium]|nr:MAG: hypothetical protein KatS3mg096_466 [Candidatus Parcubacteria bacterium]